ncbi:hypothetical protein OR263_05750 [Streptomyces sp. NEAU-H22]|uniref:hypothetical protein n=1 Tax=unclassified Streptomyces TaxID=2593676 RepID=UPI002250FA55|nr:MULTISPECIES: hypothetical protein [unclassified Streptomyces]MCX3286222.1 hypothetical protein [Streptomyces sp. NEAU-H22]WMD08816.1 hypothetical protein Q7C01_32545 [Streptomyces sp. FXY-T5]
MKLISAIAGLLAACLALGLVSKGVARSIFIACSLLLVILLVTYLAARVSRAENSLADQSRVINFFTTFLNNLAGPSLFDIEEWIEEVTVGKNGDATIRRWLTLRIGGVELPHCWTANYPTYDMDVRDHKKVTVEARSWGPARQQIGPRYNVTTTWLGKKQRLYILFDEPVPAGSVCHVFLELKWPKFFKALADGNREIVDWTTHREFRRIRSTFIIGRECGIGGVTISRLNAVSSIPNVARAGDGTVVITTEYQDVPGGSHVGYIIDRAD